MVEPSCSTGLPSCLLLTTAVGGEFTSLADVYALFGGTSPLLLPCARACAWFALPRGQGVHEFELVVHAW